MHAAFVVFFRGDFERLEIAPTLKSSKFTPRDAPKQLSYLVELR